MKLVYLDTETNGLMFDCDRLHCATIFNATDKEWVIFAPEDFISDLTESQLISIKKKANRDTASLVRLCPNSQLPIELQRADKIVAHNGAKFDIPMINKIFGCDIPVSKVIDTLILSTVSRPDRLGGNSLKSWGERLNEYKGDYEGGWDNFNYEMLVYNIQDVHVLIKLHEYIKDELGSEYDKRVGVKWKSALKLEHEVAYIIHQSEMRGFPFDYDFAVSVLEDINSRLEEIDAELDKILSYRQEYHTPMVGCAEYDEYLVNKLIKGKYPQEIMEKYRINLGTWEGTRPKPTFDVFTAKGGHNANSVKYWGEDIYQVSGPYTKLTFVKTDPDSVNQMKAYLLKRGWVPTEFTEKGSPQITEESLVELAKVDSAIGLISERYMLRHRRSILLGKDEDSTKGLLNNVRPDGRLTPYNHSYAGVTGRSRHAGIVNIPNIDSPYGPQFRKMFTSGTETGTEEWSFETYRRNKDWSIKKDENGNSVKVRVNTFRNAIVGCDASGLELRLLAHWLGSDEFTDTVLNGEVHMVFWKLIDKYISSRGKGKGITYGFLYGAGDEKLGTMADIGRESIDASFLVSAGWQQVGDDSFTNKSRMKRELPPVNFFMAQSAIIGREIRECYLKGIPALDELVNYLKEHSKKHKFLIGIDGRRLTSRSSHAALNLAIQSTGAVVMKRAIKIAHDKFRAKGVDFNLVCFMHDELQIIVSPKHVDFAKQALIESIREAGEYYDLRCPLSGESKVGLNWMHTH